jgi:hypothetical protein
MNSEDQKTGAVIMRLEDARASEGVFSSADQSIERQVHESQVVKWDTRRALAVASVHKNEAPLSFIRSLIQRGNFEAAKSSIQELRNQIDKTSSPVLALLAFEEVRIASFESQWEDLVLKTDLALRLALPPVSQLALFQMRANAHFELGNFGKASLDIDEVEQLSKLFPFAVSVLYARTLKVRVLARDRGIPQAQDLLNWILKDKMRVGKVDFDLLLTYLRVQIDLNRISKRSILKESVACFALADAIGDKLYVALAEFDFISGSSSSLDELLKKSVALGKNYQKIEKIRKELEEKIGQSTSSLTISQTVRKEKNLSELSSHLSESSFKQMILLFAELGIVADLEKSQITSIPAQGKISKALELLGNGPLSKKAFFAGIWGKQAYSPRLHDPLISNILYRLRKDSGLSVEMNDGVVELPKAIIVL